MQSSLPRAHIESEGNGDQYRRMDVVFRVMNDGVAFRYTLYGISR